MIIFSFSYSSFTMKFKFWHSMRGQSCWILLLLKCKWLLKLCSACRIFLFLENGWYFEHQFHIRLTTIAMFIFRFKQLFECLCRCRTQKIAPWMCAKYFAMKKERKPKLDWYIIVINCQRINSNQCYTIQLRKVWAL